MATPSALLAAAARDLGYSRWDDPQTGTKFGRWYADLVGNPGYGGNGIAFCAMAASYWYDLVDQGCPGLPESYVPYVYSKARKVAGSVLSNKRNAKPGDVVIFDWNNDGSLNHVGLVELNKGSYLQTIEGNSPAGYVQRHTRGWGTVAYIIRPVWEGEDASAVEDPTVIAVDGLWGHDTTALAQMVYGTEPDGEVWNQNREWRGLCPGLTIGWKWGDGDAALRAGGSPLIRAMQEDYRGLGLYTGEIDGLVGPKFNSAFIRRFKADSGAVDDGRIDRPSISVMAFQRWLMERAA